MKAIVVGAGLLGLSTAKSLADAGLEVTVLESREGVGLETSYGNGGMLTPALSDPWNAPGVHRHLAASLFDPSSALRLNVRTIPSLLGWGLDFLRYSRRDFYTATAIANFRLAVYSLAQTQLWRDELGLEYDQGTRGSLKVFRNEGALESPLALAELLEIHGLEFHKLDREATVNFEPALAPIAAEINCALHFPQDEIGDSFKFCVQLAEYLSALNVDMRTGCTATRLLVNRNRAVGVAVDGDELLADAVVVACGPKTASLLKSAGVRLSIAPAKGYSLTFDVGDHCHPPQATVIDDAMHAGVTPLGGRLRVVGSAEFAGNNYQISEGRIESLKDILRGIYPRIAQTLDLDSGEAWTGLRPMSSDGRPYIGESKVKGLFVNAGHGHLGWTEAVGSACLLTDLLIGRDPAIESAPFRVHR